MDISKIEEFLDKRTYWYHKIQLPGGVVTPGFDLEPIWDQVRKVRSSVDYRGKSVLDLASFDGMFAFEAEQAGAQTVIASDCLYKSFENFLFCREVLGSSCIPYFNVSPYNLTERLDVYFNENYDVVSGTKKFDIVQHFGLLYHLRDPMLSLLQARSVIKDGGLLIIETDFVMDSDESKMVFNGIPNAARVRDNYSVWWAPTKKCLTEMLEASLFSVDAKSISEIFFDVPSREGGRVLTNSEVVDSRSEVRVGRICMVARAEPADVCDAKLVDELRRTYRNPGLTSPFSAAF